eukprot:1146622-Pelagomonas_calceolata.AAC.2
MFRVAYSFQYLLQKQKRNRNSTACTAQSAAALLILAPQAQTRMACSWANKQAAKRAIEQASKLLKESKQHANHLHVPPFPHAAQQHTHLVLRDDQDDQDGHICLAGALDHVGHVVLVARRIQHGVPVLLRLKVCSPHLLRNTLERRAPHQRAEKERVSKGETHVLTASQPSRLREE